MQTRTLGALKVSVVGLGCNNFGRRLDEAGTRAVVDAALDAGVTLFDTADSYGDGRSEELLGRALAGRRADAVVATKFGSRLDADRGGASAAWARQACEDSLRRLGVERIDLYQLHTPDDSVPIAETLGALSELVHAGKVREVGCSNFSVEQIRDAESAAAARSFPRFVSVQNHWSLLHREPETDGVAGECAEHSLGILPYFPLASGMLTGKYRRGQEAPAGTRLATANPRSRERFASDRAFDVVERLEAFASDRGHSLLELAVSWLAAQPVVASVIAGATKPEQVRSNVEAAGWSLDPDDLAEIDTLTTDSLMPRSREVTPGR